MPKSETSCKTFAEPNNVLRVGMDNRKTSHTYVGKYMNVWKTIYIYIYNSCSQPKTNTETVTKWDLDLQKRNFSKEIMHVCFSYIAVFIKILIS